MASMPHAEYYQKPKNAFQCPRNSFAISDSGLNIESSAVAIHWFGASFLGVEVVVVNAAVTRLAVPQVV